MPFHTSPDILQEFYRRHSDSATMWELQATALRYAVEVLFRQTFADTAVRFAHRKRKSLRPSLHGPGLMLAGMMIEAMGKAVLVSRRQSAMLRSLSQHNLHQVVAAAGHVPTPEEKAFLDKLSQFVRWAGRYPVPWHAKDIAVNDHRGGRSIVGGSPLGADLRLARSIADDLEQLLPGKRVRTGMRLPSANASADPWRHKRRTK